jgi:methyltransferase (TIGR00027 family)
MPHSRPAWIAEGLLIYLPSDAQDLLFDRINELSAPGSRVATEHIPDVSMFADERSQQISERLKQYGHDIEMGDLIYHGERSDVVEYLTGHGWDVTAQKTPDAYAANGFEFPDDGAMGFFADMSYVSAVKR